MEADLGLFGTGLLPGPVWKVNNTKVSFVRDKKVVLWFKEKLFNVMLSGRCLGDMAVMWI